MAGHCDVITLPREKMDKGIRSGDMKGIGLTTRLDFETYSMIFYDRFPASINKQSQAAR